MHFFTAQTILSLLPFLLSSVLAADCVVVTGVNTRKRGLTSLSDAIDSTCADLRSGRPSTSRTSGDELFSIRATSTASTYEFCEIALQNIAAQCSDFTLGKFDFDFNGNTEHYEAQGHQDNPSQPCRVSTGLKRGQGPQGESSGPSGDSCI